MIMQSTYLHKKKKSRSSLNQSQTHSLRYQMIYLTSKPSYPLFLLRIAGHHNFRENLNRKACFQRKIQTLRYPSHSMNSFLITFIRRRTHSAQSDLIFQCREPLLLRTRYPNEFQLIHLILSSQLLCLNKSRKSTNRRGLRSLIQFHLKTRKTLPELQGSQRLLLPQFHVTYPITIILLIFQVILQLTLELRLKKCSLLKRIQKKLPLIGILIRCQKSSLKAGKL